LVEIKIYHNNGSDLMPRINVALKDNKIVTIDEVERGLDCGCVCIHCHSRLVARKGDEREHHFAHYDECETMDCYEYAFRESTKKAFSEAGEINLPINRLNEKNEVVNEVFPFKYSSVEILNSVKRSGNGLEILVELKNEKDVPLDVLICTCNKSRKNLENETFRDNISRIRVNLSNVQALTFDEFCRFLSSDIQSKEWIYNRKTDDKARKNISDVKVEDTSKIVRSPQVNKVKKLNSYAYSDYENVLNLYSVPDNRINKDKITTSKRTPEENIKLGREIWEKKFKGKR